MASAIKRGEVWYAKWTDVDGAVQRRSTTARTKKEAEAFAHELELNAGRLAERRSLGLPEVPSSCTTTLGELCEWWLRERCPEASVKKERSRLRKHIVSDPIGARRLTEVTSTLIDARLREMEREDASASSLNKLRSILHAVYSHALDANLWAGENPVARVKPRKVPSRLYETLRIDEVPLVLDAAGPWRSLIATALFLGLRKGELFGMRKSDVRLADGLLLVQRSHASETTKGKKAIALPIPTPLIAFLQDALDASTSEFLFPGPDGNRRAESTAMEKILRRMLVRAGLVVGYRHTCRRCKAKGTAATQEHPDDARRRCPTCTMMMWASAIPRPMRFHDLRHTAITLLLRMGVPMQVVQRIARHSNVRTTVDTYGHLNADDLRAALDAFALAAQPQLAAPDTSTSESTGEVHSAASADLDPLGPNQVQASLNLEKEEPGLCEISSGDRALIIGAEHQVRTGDLRLGKATLYQLS